MNLIIENLEKKMIHANETKTLISHMEHMLNPLAVANSPTFMKKDSLNSFKSKASQNKKGGKEMDRLTQNGSRQNSIHTDNDKVTKVTKWISYSEEEAFERSREANSNVIDRRDHREVSGVPARHISSSDTGKVWGQAKVPAKSNFSRG